MNHLTFNYFLALFISSQSFWRENHYRILLQKQKLKKHKLYSVEPVTTFLCNDYIRSAFIFC